MTISPEDTIVIGVDPAPIRIPLASGGYALVDMEDAELVGQYRWRARKCAWGTYAVAHIGGLTSVRMHRLILSVPAGVLVDHKNHNGLDNQKNNLRRCNESQNGGNARLNRANTSHYKGVTWDRFRNKWVAQIMINRKHIYLGRWSDPWKAAQAYNTAALATWGEYALINEQKVSRNNDDLPR
jgi:hypothetical protein